MFLVEGTEANSAVTERKGWINKAFRSEEVLVNKPCEREKEKILMKTNNSCVVPDGVISRVRHFKYILQVFLML